MNTAPLPVKTIRRTLIGQIEFTRHKIYVDGSETKNPTLIGLAVLDALENRGNTIDYELTKIRLEAYIKANNCRSTPERYELLKMLYDIAPVFDIDTVYKKMKQRGYGLSRATVYNTIALLVKCNIVHRVVDDIESKRSQYQLL